MHLDEYLKPLSSKDKKAFAERCGTSWNYMKHIISGVRTPKAALAINIERETGGQVRCETLLPDVDWEYLRNTSPQESEVA